MIRITVEVFNCGEVTTGEIIAKGHIWQDIKEYKHPSKRNYSGDFKMDLPKGGTRYTEGFIKGHDRNQDVWELVVKMLRAQGRHRKKNP